MITLHQLLAWFDRLADVYGQNREYLTELDSAIGDADHGINMARGFGAVKAKLAEKPPASLAEACKTAAMTLIKTVGGASGPLYGTLFMKLGPALGAGDSASLDSLIRGLSDGVEGIGKMGKSTAGEKTMLDAWLPALEALRAAAAGERNDAEALARAADAAEEGMRATIPMRATKGRASYLGERSMGHQDPGATSTGLMLKALAESVAQGE